MAIGMSFHFGVNRPGGDCCKLDTLRYAENAARLMSTIGTVRGFQSVRLYTGMEATASAVQLCLEQAAARLQRNDLLFLSFSGHGCSIADDNPPEEDDGRDETWCMADRMLRDDELAAGWRLFREGVRIVVVSESCFAEGSVITPIGSPLGTLALPRVAGFEAAALDPESVAAAASTPCVTDPPLDDGIKASVLLLAGTAEGIPGEDGRFSAALMDAWAGGTFEGNYCQLYREIRARLGVLQTPRVLMKGRTRPSFAHEQAFRI